MKNNVVNSKLGFVLVLLALLATPIHVNAYTLDEATTMAGAYGSGFGSLVGVYDGNVSGDLGPLTTILQNEGLLDPSLTLQTLAKSDEPNPDFVVDTLYFKDNDPTEPVVGTWDYLAGVVDFMVVKASTQFAVYAYDSAIAGGWSSLDIIKTFGNTAEPFFAMSHLTAVSAVPLPAAAPLFLSALALIGFVASRRKKQI